jgi:hypothetical protein
MKPGPMDPQEVRLKTAARRRIVVNENTHERAEVLAEYGEWLELVILPDRTRYTSLRDRWKLEPELDDTTRCPIGEACRWCGADTKLVVSTFDTPSGVLCDTLCRTCRSQGRMSEGTWRMSPAEAVLGVLDHCEHLGIDLDEMAAARQAEEARGE